MIRKRGVSLIVLVITIIIMIIIADTVILGINNVSLISLISNHVFGEYLSNAREKL